MTIKVNGMNLRTKPSPAQLTVLRFLALPGAKIEFYLLYPSWRIGLIPGAGWTGRHPNFQTSTFDALRDRNWVKRVEVSGTTRVYEITDQGREALAAYGGNDGNH